MLFKSFIQRLEKAAHLADKIHADIAAKMKELVLETFDKEQDPYGNPWAKRTKPYEWKILNKTGKLRDSFEITEKFLEVDIKNDAPYSIYHQKGTERMPQRKLLPDGKRLPDKWKQELKKIAIQDIKDLFRR